MATNKQFPLSVVIQAVDKITAPMRKINREINDTFKPVRMLGASLQALGRESGIGRIAQGISAARGHLNDASNAASQFLNNLLLAGAAGAGVAVLFKRQFIDTADTFERLRLSLNAIEGSAEAGGKSMAFIMDKAMQTPYNTEEIAKTFRIMRGFGLDPTNGSLQSIVDQVSKLGGTGDDLKGIAMQLGQAWGKARLQAEDANIMVERGVPVWGLLERGAARLGKTIPIKQLREMSEKGQLGQKAIKLLVEQMGIESRGASAAMMKTWSGMVSNLGDYWERFKLKIMASGPFEWLKTKLQGLLDTIDRMSNDGSLDKLAEKIGGDIVNGLKAIYQFGNDAFDVLKSLWAPIKALYDIFGSWKPLLYAVGIYMGSSLVLALASTTAAMWALTTAMLANPFGVFVLGIAAVVTAGIFLGKGINLLIDRFKQFGLIKGILEPVFRFMLDFMNPLGIIIKSLSAIGSFAGIKGAGNLSLSNMVMGSNAPAAASGTPANKGKAMGLLSSTQTNNASVAIDFNNLPTGAVVRPTPGSVPLTLNLGGAMGGF